MDGMLIKEFLVKNKISQLFVADKIEINPAGLNGWLNGHRDLPVKYHQDLCKVLGIDLQSLHDGEIVIKKPKKLNDLTRSIRIKMEHLGRMAKRKKTNALKRITK